MTETRFYIKLQIDLAIHNKPIFKEGLIKLNIENSILIYHIGCNKFEEN